MGVNRLGSAIVFYAQTKFAYNVWSICTEAAEVDRLTEDIPMAA